MGAWRANIRSDYITANLPKDDPAVAPFVPRSMEAFEEPVKILPMLTGISAPADAVGKKSPAETSDAATRLIEAPDVAARS
jgi:hypothetical protein